MVFKDRLSTREFVGAMVIMSLHCVFLPRIIAIAALFLRLDIGGAQFNLVYYIISFSLVLLFMGGYLRRSFDNLLDHPMLCLKQFFIAWGLCFVLNIAVNILLIFIGVIDSNPNQNTVEALASTDKRTMMVLAVLLAPMVEEPIFRGGVFCTLRRRSRIAAYVVTVLLFGLYHIWSYMISARDITILIYVLQYVPGGIALCYAYDKSGSIWTAILFHMSYNFISML